MVDYNKIFSSESEDKNHEQSQEGIGKIAFITIASIMFIGEIVKKIQEVHKKSVLKKNKKKNPDYNIIANDIKDFLQCISDNVVKTANVISKNYDVRINNYCANKDKLSKKVETMAQHYFNEYDSIIVFSDVDDDYNYEPDDSRVERMAGDGALFDEFIKSIESDKRLKRIQNKDEWKFVGKKIEFEFYLNDYSFNDNEIGLHISLNEIDKSMSSESEDKDEEGTEVGVYACSQGVFDTNSKPFEIGGYQIDVTKTDSSEQSED